MMHLIMIPVGVDDASFGLADFKNKDGSLQVQYMQVMGDVKSEELPEIWNKHAIKNNLPPIDPAVACYHVMDAGMLCPWDDAERVQSALIVSPTFPQTKEQNTKINDILTRAILKDSMQILSRMVHTFSTTHKEVTQNAELPTF
jgi:hypothetical protein